MFYSRRNLISNTEGVSCLIPVRSVPIGVVSEPLQNLCKFWLIRVSRKKDKKLREVRTATECMQLNVFEIIMVSSLRLQVKVK